MSISVSAIQTAYTAYVGGLSTYNTALAAVQTTRTTIAAITFPTVVSADADYNTPLAALATANATLTTQFATLVTAQSALPALEQTVIALMPANEWVSMATQTQWIGYTPKPVAYQQHLFVRSTLPTQNFPLY